MTNPITALESDLSKLATLQGGSYQPTAALTAAQDVLWLLADQSIVGTDISTAVTNVFNTIATTITTDVVGALNGIATELGKAPFNTLNTGDATTALGALQNALQTSQTLAPGASSAAASALASTTQFATLFANLLAGGVSQAITTLTTIADQLQTVAGAFSTAPAGNP
jgi:hypothetical protein